MHDSMGAHTVRLSALSDVCSTVECSRRRSPTSTGRWNVISSTFTKVGRAPANRYDVAKPSSKARLRSSSPQSERPSIDYLAPLGSYSSVMLHVLIE